LNFDFLKIQSTFFEKMNLDQKSNQIIWIKNGCGLDH